LKDIESIISDLEQQRSAIDRAILALHEVAGAPVSSSATASKPPQKPANKKRAITPAGRRRIAEAMRRRWAAKRLANKNSATPQKMGSSHKGGTEAKAATKKHRLNPEGRMRIIAATKRRWAAKRVAQGSGAATNMVSGRKKRAKKQTTV
jgi:hypothetical protein